VKKLLILSLLFVTGCSTSPVADFLDYFFPGRPPVGATPYGGVCVPQGEPIGSPGVFPSAPPPPPPGVTGAPVIVPPAPAGAATGVVPFPQGR
jgi:hypothetical protein